MHINIPVEFVEPLTIRLHVFLDIEYESILNSPPVPWLGNGITKHPSSYHGDFRGTGGTDCTGHGCSWSYGLLPNYQLSNSIYLYPSTTYPGRPPLTHDHLAKFSP